MENTAAAPKYTPEQIERAMAYVANSRQKERDKYQRNKEHRLAYSKAYYAAHKEAIAEKHKAAYAAAHPKAEPKQ